MIATIRLSDQIMALGPTLTNCPTQQKQGKENKKRNQ
jgi:hypothetical protein